MILNKKITEPYSKLLKKNEIPLISKLEVKLKLSEKMKNFNFDENENFENCENYNKYSYNFEKYLLHKSEIAGKLKNSKILLKKSNTFFLYFFYFF